MVSVGQKSGQDLVGSHSGSPEAEMKGLARAAASSEAQSLLSSGC